MACAARRVYAYEYRIDSMEPQLVWGVAGVGLGQNESARKFKLRQRVLVTCKVRWAPWPSTGHDSHSVLGARPI